MIRRTVLRRLAKLEKEMTPVNSEPLIINVTFIDPITKQQSGKGFQVVIPASGHSRPNASRTVLNRSRE
jgi:hypothetical protein